MNLTEFSIDAPHDIEGLPQDQEYCILSMNGQQRKLRLHDYHEIYKIPGLYEELFYNLLECNSPAVVTSCLVDSITSSNMAVSDLAVLELGAGNGIVGEALTDNGVDSIVGIDIIEEALQAAERDRPEVYDEYFVEDLCDLSADVELKLETTDFNCLVCVAALGFGDIPPEAFINAYNFIADDGWVAFNIKEDFITDDDHTGFARLIHQIIEDGILDIQHTRRYQHRLALDNSPLHYTAIVGNKRAPIVNSDLVS